MKYFDAFWHMLLHKRLVVSYLVKRQKPAFVFSLAVGLAITIGVGALRGYSEHMQGGIAKKVVRFHVLANSNTSYDQALKLRVRDAVLEDMTPFMQDCKTAAQSLSVLEANKVRIGATAKKEIARQGYDYDVNVFLSQDLFPMKKYGSLTFPAGNYQALRIEIGSAAGNNWWCVMFPPMCFIDANYTTPSNEGVENLKGILDEEEFSVVAFEQNTNDIRPEVKFKIVEWWQELKSDKSQYVTNQ